MKLLLDLFFTFFKIALFTIGGGYAMIPFIQRDVVELKKWMEEDEFINILAIAEATPGPVAVNTATYVGYNKKGMLGVIFATLGVVLPSFLVIILVTKFFWDFRSNEIVAKAFKGVRVAVVALIASTVLNLIKKVGMKPLTILISLIVILLLAFTKIEAVFIILFFAIGAIVVNAMKVGEIKK